MYKDKEFTGYDCKKEHCYFCQKDTLHEYIKDKKGHRYAVCTECFKFTDIIEDDWIIEAFKKSFEKKHLEKMKLEKQFLKTMFKKEEKDLEKEQRKLLDLD